MHIPWYWRKGVWRVYAESAGKVRSWESAGLWLPFPLKIWSEPVCKKWEEWGFKGSGEGLESSWVGIGTLGHWDTGWCTDLPHVDAMLSCFSCVRLCATHRRQPTRLPRPWDSPGKNTGVGYHFLLQCVKVKSESEVAQLCPTLSDPMDCSLPGSSVHGTFQARVLEWGAIAFSGTKC